MMIIESSVGVGVAVGVLVGVKVGVGVGRAIAVGGDVGLGVAVSVEVSDNVDVAVPAGLAVNGDVIVDPFATMSGPDEAPPNRPPLNTPATAARPTRNRIVPVIKRPRSMKLLLQSPLPPLEYPLILDVSASFPQFRSMSFPSVTDIPALSSTATDTVVRGLSVASPRHTPKGFRGVHGSTSPDSGAG